MVAKSVVSYDNVPFDFTNSNGGIGALSVSSFTSMILAPELSIKTPDFSKNSSNSLKYSAASLSPCHSSK